jgi:hypothetical protein
VSERGRGTDQVGVGVAAPVAEHATGTTDWLFERWDEDQTRWAVRRSGLAAPQGADFHRLKIAPYSVTEHHGNLIVNAGWTRILNLATAGGGQALTATSGRIGAGNSSTAAADTQTDLQAAAGAANRWFQVLSTGPTVSVDQITLAAAFGTADGNFVWAEFGIDIGTPTVTSSAVVNATLLNRAVSAQGTKASGQTWTATATLTFT